MKQHDVNAKLYAHAQQPLLLLQKWLAERGHHQASEKRASKEASGTTRAKKLPPVVGTNVHTTSSPLVEKSSTSKALLSMLTQRNTSSGATSSQSPTSDGLLRILKRDTQGAPENTRAAS